jgi:Helix-turn-helix domain
MSAPRLSIIPAGAVTDRSLEPRDLQVLCLFGRHTDKAGWCVRSQVKVAQELGCSRASLQNSIDRLAAAGWLQKKRRDLDVEEAGKQPSRSYSYRVILDRDDYAFDAATARDDDEPDSHAENASEQGGCQPVGTPVPAEKHPGATPCVGTGANTYVGTKNDPLERSHLERERDARARERTARFLAAFELRWPTAAVDDRQRTAYAAEALNEGDQEAALQGIGPFLEDLKTKRGKSGRVPAGWKYLEQRRWELLGKADASDAGPASHPADSPEGRAIIALYGAAGLDALLRATVLRHGVLYCRLPITPRVLAFGELPPREHWHELTRQQAGAWDAFFREMLPNVLVRKTIREGWHMPHQFPPRIDGTWSPPTGPPIQPEPTEDDLADFR